MHKIMMILPFFFSGALAQAGDIECVGSYSGYDFDVKASETNSTVTGNINCVISASGQVEDTEVLQPTSSQIIAGESIQFAGKNSDVSGTVKTTYQNGQYIGTLDANSTGGDIELNVTCTLN